MLTREQVLGQHSPAVWGLLTGAAVFAVELVGIVAWNLWDRRGDIRIRL